MDARSLRFIAEACRGELLSGSPETLALRVCSDSRQAQAGDLFVALTGERFDGHDFLPEVARKAAAAMVQRQRVRSGERGCATVAANGKYQNGLDLGSCAVIAVENTRKALGRLAARYREDFALPIIAIGGSNGKTTTKNLVASVLGQKLTTLSSEASFNNDLGVPLTLLKLERSHQAAVLEAGTNHPGELEPLLGMIRPKYGVVTSIAREHLEFFGDLAGVAREEGWLAEVLPPAGKLLINGDSEWTAEVARRSRAAVVRIGLEVGNDWRVAGARLDKQGVTFRVEGPHAEFSGEYRVNLLGRHQAVNALLAIVLGVELGLSRAEIERGLAECKPAKMRLQLWELSGVRVLDDAYNANADSMVAALHTLKALPCKGRRVAVLGDMAELGTHSESTHEEVGRRAAELGVEQLFAVGQMASVMARGAREAGLSRVLVFGDVEAAAVAVKQFVRSGDLLLLKASRATRLERVAEHLRRTEGARYPEHHATGK
jgi:UDP-N-acetylmuramoyl-tripeptide--D-alanyl-D-alanine ligase